MAGQQIRDDRASAASVHNCGRRDRSGKIIFCRYMTQARQASVFALSLVGQEKEGFVLDDGTAERAAKLVIVEWILWKGANIEVVAGVEGTVTKVFECGAVELIVPDLVTRFTMAPEFLPNCASTPERTGISASASRGRRVAGVPQTPGSLMAGLLW
jgi:hypothetical protein